MKIHLQNLKKLKEFKMNKQKESFSFDIPLELPEKWMMGVTSLEVYNTVYNITEKNKKLKILLKDEQLESINVDTQSIKNLEYLYKISDTATLISHNIVKILNCIVESFSENKKLIMKNFEYLKKIIYQLNKAQHIVNIAEFEYEVLDNCFAKELPPGAYELVDINSTIRQIFSESKIDTLIFGIEADTLSRKSVLTTSNSIHFNSELYKL